MSRSRRTRNRNRGDRRVLVFTDLPSNRRQPEIVRFLTRFGLDQARLEAKAVREHEARSHADPDEPEEVSHA